MTHFVLKHATALVAGFLHLGAAGQSLAAALSLEQMQTANGLAEIVSSAEICGYAINQTAIEDYYLKSGLATPEALSFITSKIATSTLGAKPSPTSCTLTKATARTIGILSE